MLSSAAGMFADIAAVNDTGTASRNILMEMFGNLIPSSLMLPFMDNNVLQLIVLGFLVGSAVQIADAKALRSVIEELHVVLQKVIVMFLKFVQVIVFCSTIRQMLSTGTDTLKQMSWVFAACAFGVIIAALLYYAAAVICLVKGKGSFKNFVSVSGSAMLTAASILSGKAAIPSNMMACKQL